MSMVQLGNGWLNTEKGTYTSYDPQTGQLTSKFATGLYDPNTGQLDQAKINTVMAGGDINQYIRHTDSNYLGGRSNVNLGNTVKLAANELMKSNPKLTWEDAQKYANKWVNDRVAAGHDANEIEDLAKGALRDDKQLGDGIKQGLSSMFTQDELAARDNNATGADLAPQGDGRGSIQDELRAFAGRMMSTLPPDSPQVQRIAELAQQAGNKYATQSGMGPGGITAMGVANTAARANVDLQTQRDSIGANALAAAGNQQLSVDALNTQLQQGNQQANTMQGANIGGLIGSGIGAIGGIVGSAYTSGAMAPAIPGLIQAGGSAGSALGGTIANGAQGPIKYGGQQQSTNPYKGRSWGTS